MSAPTISTRARQLATATESWRTLQPTVGALVDVQMAADALVHDLAMLSDSELIGGAESPRNAGAIACEIANTCRALQTTTIGFRTYLPDTYSLAAVRRLSLTLRRALASLSAVMDGEKK